MASIFAWTGALAHRARLDDTPEVDRFAKAIERACVDTIEDGTLTKDLAMAIHKTIRPPEGSFVTTDDYLEAVESRLEKSLAD